jgi:hypothetical protein
MLKKLSVLISVFSLGAAIVFGIAGGVGCSDSSSNNSGTGGTIGGSGGATGSGGGGGAGGAAAGTGGAGGAALTAQQINDGIINAVPATNVVTRDPSIPGTPVAYPQCQ